MQSQPALSGATFSTCTKFRYRLWRHWDDHLVRLTFVMLNPSTADADENDATIRKCRGFAERLGYGGIEVVNLFAYRATQPRDLKKAGYLVGPDNAHHTELVIRQAQGAVICAWGSNAKGLATPLELLHNMRAWGVQPMALQVNHGGIPAHPCMLPYTCKPISF